MHPQLSFAILTDPMKLKVPFWQSPLGTKILTGVL
jgi:hypothetical protein